MEQFNGISYDPQTGEIAGRKAHLHKTGYLKVSVGGKNYSVHRLAWYLSYGYWPARVDHINRNKTDNRLCNLREATMEQSAQNRVITSKYMKRWVYFDQTHKGPFKYRARIQAFGRRKHVGWFLTEELAVREAERAVRELHGEFASLEHT